MKWSCAQTVIVHSTRLSIPNSSSFHPTYNTSSTLRKKTRKNGTQTVILNDVKSQPRFNIRNIKKAKMISLRVNEVASIQDFCSQKLLRKPLAWRTSKIKLGTENPCIHYVGHFISRHSSKLSTPCENPQAAFRAPKSLLWRSFKVYSRSRSKGYPVTTPERIFPPVRKLSLSKHW